VIKEVTEFIETKAGLTRDTDLFAGHRPQGITVDCDVILESAGGSVFSELPERADVVFQVLSRAKTYFTARARAWAIYDAIYRNWTYGSAGWTLCLTPSDLISSCDVILPNWVAAPAGVLSIDTVDYQEGTGSLVHTIAGPGININYYITYDPAGTWDWSAREYILFWLESEGASTEFTNVRFYIREGANWRYWDLTFSAGAGKTFKLKLSTGDAESITAPNLALIDRIELIFRTTGIAEDLNPFYYKIDHIRVIIEGYKEYEAMTIEPLATPQYIGQDEKGRYEFSTNYIFKIKKL